IVSTAGNDVIILVNEELGQSLRIFTHLLDICQVIITQSLSICNGLGRNGMLQRTTLCAREYRQIQQLRDGTQLAFWCLDTPWIFKILTYHDHTSTRTT